MMIFGVCFLKSTFTSDSSRERVSKRLHIFGLCFSLILLSSEDNLNGTLRKLREKNITANTSNKGSRGKGTHSKTRGNVYLGTHDSDLS